MKKAKQRFFIQDKVLKNSDDDFFRHKDLAKNISDLINNDNYQTPYNIALIGKWGLGKSSLLNFIRPQISHKCNFFFINAWKYEKESLKRVYLKAIYEQIKEDRVPNINKVLEFIKDLRSKDKVKNYSFWETIKQVCRIMWRPGVWAIIISIIFALITSNVKFIANNGNYQLLLEQGVFNIIIKFLDYYFDNLTANFILPLFVLLMGLYVNDIIAKVKTPINIELPIESADDYELLLMDEIKALIRKTGKEKVVVVIDDLDRLSTTKIVEALDTLKCLMEMNQCIFIVPFDDTLIKSALEKRVVSQVDNEHQTIKSELILDKLFQFKFYLQPLIPSNIKDYTLDMIKKEAPDFINLFEIDGVNYFDEVIKKTVIYKGLETPRQIKKIVNILANNLLIIRERCQSKITENKLLSKDGLYLLSKISVLQADFNDFYDTLFNKSNNIETLLEIHNNPVEWKDIPYDLKFLFEPKTKSAQGKPIIKKENDNLLNFLSDTRTISHKNIGAYLHLNQDKFSVKYGSDFNTNITNAIESSNIPTAQKLINEAKEDLTDLIKEILEEVSDENLSNALITLYSISQSLGEKSSNTLFNLLSDKTQDFYTISNSQGFLNYDMFSIEKLLYVYLSTDSVYRKGIEKLIINYIDKTFKVDKAELSNLSGIINTLFENDSKISSDIKNQLLNSIKYAVFDTDLMSIDFFVNNIKVVTKEQFIYYLGMPFYKKICLALDEIDTVNKEYINWLNLCVDSLMENKQNKDDIFEQLTNLYKKEANLKFLNDIIFRYWGDKNE